MKDLINSIFSINSQSEFRQVALAVFNYQATENEVYAKYLSGLGIITQNITEIHQIPFLPVELFKSHQITTGKSSSHKFDEVFTSSGTTGMIQSKHYVKDVSIYETSYLKGFELFYGDIKDYCILALLPSYLEREGSSLIYMADDLIKKSEHQDGGFYLNNYDELISKLKKLEAANQKTILLGVTYALLDLSEKLSVNKESKRSFTNLIIMETGGMKGKRKEMLREELHAILCDGFGVKEIHSEYGMTELLSQAYSKGNGIFYCPPWMKILIRDTNDPLTSLPDTKSGGINIVDLANINSCSFIATQDLGKTFPDQSFEVLGRFDNSDIRGCNLLIQ